jgi:hypothetical protein
MAKVSERKLLARANSAFALSVLGLVCGGLAFCAFAAVAFDLSRLFVE